MLDERNSLVCIKDIWLTQVCMICWMGSIGTWPTKLGQKDALIAAGHCTRQITHATTEVDASSGNVVTAFAVGGQGAERGLRLPRCVFLDRKVYSSV